MSTVLPSGLNATAQTRPGCVRGWPRGWPVAASQSRAVLSSLPVITVLPSGLNATAMDRALMRQGLAEGLARRRVPEPRRLVLARR